MLNERPESTTQSQKYVVTIDDGVRTFCPTCATTRFVYAVEENGERKWCCCSCQRIHKTEPASQPVMLISGLL